jgi:hypothetical protein
MYESLGTLVCKPLARFKICIIKSCVFTKIYSDILDIFEDYASPTTAAQTLLYTAAKKRKEVYSCSL